MLGVAIDYEMKSCLSMNNRLNLPNKSSWHCVLIFKGWIQHCKQESRMDFMPLTNPIVSLGEIITLLCLTWIDNHCLISLWLPPPCCPVRGAVDRIGERYGNFMQYCNLAELFEQAEAL